MIDYHCHLLPGLDDGPDHIDEALVMARALRDFGFRDVCCTPHCIFGHYDLTPTMVREQVRALQGRVSLAGIDLRLHAGMEYYLDEYFPRVAGNLLPLGKSSLVLCEAPPEAHPQLIIEMLELIVRQGLVPLIAHPERTPPLGRMLACRWSEEIEEEPKSSLLRRFLARGQGSTQSTNDEWVGEFPTTTLFQANLGSFNGYYGSEPQRQAYQLLQRGVYSCLASDLHSSAAISAVLSAGLDKLQENPDLSALVDFVPLAG